MEANEVAEKLVEFEEKENREDSFRRRVALLISVLAMLLAIVSAAGGKTAKEMITAAIGASDSWAFYQAKSIRQTSYQLAGDEIETLLLANPGLSEEARKTLTERQTHYRDTVKRYDSEADGSGKKELQEKARELEHERDVATAREPYFAFAEALLQIAIVMASAAVATGARFLIKLAAGVGVVGVLLALDGWTLLLALPL